MYHVRRHHMARNRADALNAYFTTGEIVYKFEPLKRKAPCPNIGFKNNADCLAAFAEKAQHYHHTEPKNQPWPLRPENQPMRNDLRRL